VRPGASLDLSIPNIALLFDLSLPGEYLRRALAARKRVSGMRKFSRWMPLLPPTRFGMGDWIALIVIGAFLAGILAFVVWAVVESPVCAGSAILLFLLPWIVAARSSRRYERNLANERKGEDIGTFARAFDRRVEPFDPWVVRASWEALQVYVSFPLRPTDRLIEDLCIDPDDIDLALLVDVAKRSRHSLDDPKANPYFAKFFSFQDVTVGDFVKLISWQPKIEEKASPVQ
jgi:hypothetical protein